MIGLATGAIDVSTTQWVLLQKREPAGPAAHDEPTHIVPGLHHVADEHVRAEWLAVPADGHRDGHFYGREAAQAERLRGDRVRVYWWGFIRLHLRAHGARDDPAAALRDVAVLDSL